MALKRYPDMNIQTMYDVLSFKYYNGPVLVKDLQTTPLKKSRFEFMILIDALCFEKNEKPPKKFPFLFFEMWSFDHLDTH